MNKQIWSQIKNAMLKHWIRSIFGFILICFALKGCIGAVKIGMPFSVKHIVVSAVTKTLETDENGHTNILLIGMGGEGHDGEHLTDTMIIASIDYKNNLIPMLSIPRDLFVENEAVGWGTRINSIYEYIYEETGSKDAAIMELQKEMEEVLGISIQYHAQIDFKGFEEIIDGLGGININMESAFYDPYYPAPPGSNAIYEAFYLAAGEQVLNGEQALKYARSRKTSSDFDRAKRQQELLDAIRDKAMGAGFLLNPIKWKNVLSGVQNNFYTNLSLSELGFLASLAKDLDNDSILTRVLNDDPNQVGGILYTPDRNLYAGAFVLIPYVSDFEEMHQFANLYLHKPEMFKKKISIEIQNGTKHQGLAGLAGLYLNRYGFEISSHGNAESKDFLSSEISQIKNSENAKEAEEILNFLPSFLGIEESITETKMPEEPETNEESEIEENEAEILLILGEDFYEFYIENKEKFYLGFY